MDAWPALFELEAFLGTVALFPAEGGEHWFHQGVRFNRVAADEQIRCAMLPFDGQFMFRWSVAGEDRIDLQLQSVRKLEIRRDVGGERLACFVREGGVDQCFTITLDPTVRLQVTAAR
ncbi:hypothetical protein [Chitinolyticbacter meiyuanensis]|uniref:hypothetical protein n=1 Tax=Chitinolyticbacter meiyuanensis TaxID=682798 RepID=UPI0011E5AA63|nr:hypothetical protein [Chitinolyticbacter meiyuanensis]